MRNLVVCGKVLEYNEGMFCTLLIYWQRIQNMLFLRRTFGRGDINVYHDAHVGGVEHMQIGQHFLAGRGL